jgi:hypothetical protein
MRVSRVVQWGTRRSELGAFMTRFAGWVTGLTLLLAGCESTGPRDLELEAARTRWMTVGPDAYVYAVQRQCFCGLDYIGPARLTVEDGVVVESVYVDSGLPVPDGYDFPTVDGLLEILRSAYEREAHEVTVTYDPVSGVPVQAWIDYEEMVADEELGWLVTEEVTPVP